MHIIILMVKIGRLSVSMTLDGAKVIATKHYSVYTCSGNLSYSGISISLMQRVGWSANLDD